MLGICSSAAKAKDCYDRAVKWIQLHQYQVSLEWTEELKSFRAEADAVLAKSDPGAKDYKKTEEVLLIGDPN